MSSEREHRIAMAILAVKNGTTIRKAAVMHGIAKSTLSSRLKAKVQIGVTKGPHCHLGADIEKSIVEWVVYMASVGHAQSKNQILDKVQEMVKDLGVETPFVDGRPSSSWWKSFRKRQPLIQSSMAPSTGMSKILADMCSPNEDQMVEVQSEPIENWEPKNTVLECNEEMLENQLYTDITFNCKGDDDDGNSLISAHKYMLISRSAVFRVMLTGLPRNHSSVIDIDDVPRDIFKEMLRFLYTERSNLRGNNVLNILYCAKKYMLSGLVDKCRDYIQNNISTQTVCEMLELVSSIDEPNLTAQCLEVIDVAAKDVLETEGFTELKRDTVEMIVERDTLDIAEETLYSACYRWATAECTRQNVQVTGENIREVLGSVLYCIRFPLLESQHLEQIVRDAHILTKEEAFDVIQYKNGSDVTGSSLPFPVRKRATVWKRLMYKKLRHSISDNIPNPATTRINVKNKRNNVLLIKSVLVRTQVDIIIDKVALGHNTSSSITALQDHPNVSMATFETAVPLCTGEHVISVGYSSPRPSLSSQPGITQISKYAGDDLSVDNENFTLSFVDYSYCVVGFLYKSVNAGVCE